MTPTRQNATSRSLMPRRVARRLRSPHVSNTKGFSTRVGRASARLPTSQGQLRPKTASLPPGRPKAPVRSVALISPETPPIRGIEAPRSNPQSLKKGRGFACSFKNVGFSFGFPERCEATVELIGEAHIDKVILHHAGAEVGQGSHTVFMQMVAEAIGVDVSQVELDMSDTASSGDSGSVSASRMTWMAGNAIRKAAEIALERWTDEDRPAIGHHRFVPPATTPYDLETGVCMPNFTYGYVAEAVELTVDVDTGHIHIDRVVCANDVGKAINPTLIEGQIEGAVVQAHGYSLMENLQVKNGRIQNPYLSQYLIPGIKDVPDQVDSVIMEIPDPIGPWAHGVWPKCPSCR